MKDKLIVFIDALPYKDIKQLRKMYNFMKTINPLQPGFGYSVNVKSELFANLTPDEVGFLNEWTYAPANGIFIKLPKVIDEMVGITRFTKRFSNKVLSKLLKVNLRNIEFSKLWGVNITGVNAYESGYDKETIFSKFNIKRYVHTEYGSDENAYLAVCKDLEKKAQPQKIFLAMAELDHIMHRDGMHSNNYFEELARLDSRVDKLWKLLKERNNKPEMLVLSDHGMADVKFECKFNIEDTFPMNKYKYFYFVDATMVRIWTEDTVILAKIKEWLSKSNFQGHVLTREERINYGITSQKFGDIIFLLDEEWQFVPNFIGDKKVKAMHGYLPTLKSQFGVLAKTIRFDDDNKSNIYTPRMVYNILERFVTN